MKNFYFSLSLFLLPLLFIGCKEEKEQDIYSRFNVRYDYTLAFIDEEGKDLIEGIFTTTPFNGGGILLREGTYTYEIVEQNSDDRFAKPNNIYIFDVKGYKTLRIFNQFAQDGDLSKNPKMFSSKFTNPHIFGDSEVHTIVTYWEFDKSYNDATLIRFTVDGIDAQVTEGLDGGLPLVIMTLPK